MPGMCINVQAEREVHTCVHEVTKELPARGHLKEGQILLLSYPIQGCTGGHASCYTLRYMES